MGRPWTQGQQAARRRVRPARFDVQVERLNELYPNLPTSCCAAWSANTAHARKLLGDAHRLEELGELFGADLTAREVDYLMRQ